MLDQAHRTKFSYFPRLPLELRQLIWKLTVLMAADHPEVLILVPEHVFPRSFYHTSATAPFPLVNTGYPVAMHVNREAREVALRHVMLGHLSRDQWNKGLVPQRSFRPEIDTLYAARTAIPTDDFCYEHVQTVQHLALDSSNQIAFDMANFFLSAASRMAALRTLRFVSHWPSQPVLCSNPSVVPLPHRRCALFTIETVLFEQPRVYSTEYNDVVDGDFDKYISEVVILSPGGLAGSLRAIEMLTWKVIYRSIHMALSQGRVPYVDEGIGTEIMGDLLFEQLCEIRRRVTMEICLMTEFRHSPLKLGDSQFVAVEEKLPDSDKLYDHKLYDHKLYDHKLYDHKLYDCKLYNRKPYNRKPYNRKLYDRKLYGPKLFDPKLYDPPHKHCSFSDWCDAIMQQLKQITWEGHASAMTASCNDEALSAPARWVLPTVTFDP